MCSCAALRRPVLACWAFAKFLRLGSGPDCLGPSFERSKGLLLFWNRGRLEIWLLISWHGTYCMQALQDMTRFRRT